MHRHIARIFVPVMYLSWVCTGDAGVHLSSGPEWQVKLTIFETQVHFGGGIIVIVGLGQEKLQGAKSSR